MGQLRFELESVAEEQEAAYVDIRRTYTKAFFVRQTLIIPKF
jgi:hypothetical protein